MMNELLILQLLLNKKGWLTSNEISSNLNISIRTIRSVIKAINCKETMVISSPKGYQLNNDFRDYVKSYLIDSNINKETNTPAVRQEYIIKQLLLCNNELDFYELADSLYVSESTLTNDLAFIRKKFELYELVLTRKKDVISIIGDEKNIRKLVSDHIYSEIKDGLLNFNILNSVFPEYDVLAIRSILVEIILKNELSIDDFGITDIVLHICIMLNRISNDKHITVNYSVNDYEKTIYAKITKDIFNKIEKITDIPIDDSEINIISPLIAVNTKQLLDKNITLHDLRHFVNPDIINFVQQVTNKLSESYTIDLNNNDFIIRFSLHLNQILNTVNRSNRNPLLKNIKDSYPLIFELSVFIAVLIHEKYPDVMLDDHEISYISLHVGMSIDKDNHNKVDAILITPDYYRLKEKIINLLEHSFPMKINIVRTYNDESEVDFAKHFDLILSTQSVSVSSNAEFLQITPFINDNDFSNIQYILEVINLKKKLNNNQSLYSLFDEKCFTIIENTDLSKEEIISLLCEKALKENYIEERFILDVLKREQLSSTSYSNLAVPHSLKPAGLKTRILIGLFKDYYVWDSNTINIVLLLIVNENDKDEFKNLFQNIITIFTSKIWLESYKKINNFKNFIEIIKKF